MYERFTDRARKVMQLANREAQRFSHEYIGTEHVLLGLIKEGSGVAASVLRVLKIDPRKIHLEVEKLIKSGPDMVTMGKRPQTPRAKRVIEYSMEEARNLNNDYVGTEHILLGLLREQEGVAAQALMNLGLNSDIVRRLVLGMFGRDMLLSERGALDPSKLPQALIPAETAAEINRLQKQKEDAVASLDFEKAAEIRDRIEGIKNKEQAALVAKIEELRQQFQPQTPRSPDREISGGNIQSAPRSYYSRFTDRARRVMQLANQEAQRFNHEYIGTEHVLLGLIKEDHGVAANVLKSFDIKPAQRPIEVEKLIQQVRTNMVDSSGLAQTPRAKKVIEYSMEEARSLNHNYVVPSIFYSDCYARKRAWPRRFWSVSRTRLGGRPRTGPGNLGAGISRVGTPNTRPVQIARIANSKRRLPPSLNVCKSRKKKRSPAWILRKQPHCEMRPTHSRKSRSRRLQAAGMVDQPYQPPASRSRTSRGSENVPIGVPPVPEDFESRFSRRGRKVIELANREAIRRNNEYIGTEHLLLALIKLGGDGAASVLKVFGVDRHKVRAEIVKLIQSGPNLVRLPKLPKTPRTKQVLKYSWEEAWAMDSEFVETEHILLGILRENECVAAQVLFNLGLGLESARREIKNLPRQ